MKYLSLVFKIFTVLLLLLTDGWIISCTDDVYPGSGEIDNGIQFTLEVPNKGIPKVTTRTMAGTGLDSKEDEIRTVDVLVFDASSSPEMFLEWVEGTNVNQDLTINTKAGFNAVLTSTTASTRIVVVANKSLSAIATGFAGKNKAQVMEMLTHSSTSAWKADGSTSSGYTPIPMYGEVVVPKINSSMTLTTPIPLTRILARIDVLNNASNFTLEKIYLVNYNTVGYVAPGWDTDGQVDNTLIPNIPSSSGKQTGASHSYTVGNGVTSYVGEIYTFEAAAAVDAERDPDTDNPNDDDPARKDAVCLIVEGKYQGSTTYYRIDFLAAGTGDYIALKRNYKYIVDIKQANAIGYASFEDALDSYRVMTNLTVRLITYGSQEKIKSVVYNGQYMLGVGEPEIELFQYYNSAYTVDVYTDSPGGWEASIPSGSWLTFGDGTTTATGDPNEDNSFSLLIPYYNEPIGSVRQETITVTAGRLTHQVTVQQSVKDPGMIRFMDAYGNILDNGLFFPMQDANGANLEPQTVYVMWTTNKVDVWRQPRDEYNGDIPMDYISFAPNIPADKNNKVPIYTGIQAITMQPKTGSEDWRWDVLYFDIYDDNNNFIGNQPFRVNQGALTFKIYNYPNSGSNDTYQLDLGPVHTLDLGSNVNWEITKVEEIGNTGLLGTTDQDIRVGTSNRVDKPNIIPNWNTAYVTIGTDLVAQEGRYYLNFPTGDWVLGKTGTVRVTFRNLMHTAGENGQRDDTNIYEHREGSDDDYFPFYKTIDLVLTGLAQLSYTTSDGDSYFLVNRKEYANENGTAAYMSFQTAQTNCSNLGAGWRMPSMQELMLSYIYVNALGGSGSNVAGKWYDNFRYWSSTQSSGGNYWGFQLSEPAGKFENALSGTDNWQATLRCVKDQSSGTYPRLTPSYTDAATNIKGTLIVSREGSNGVDPLALLSTNGIPPGTDNRVAPKLLVENTSTEPSEPYEDRTWTVAQNTCTKKGAGWRLPTLREVQLIWLLGGTDETTFGGYKSLSWGSNFQKLGLIGDPANNNGMVWTMTENGSGEVYALNVFTPLGYYTDTRSKTGTGLEWVGVRCVKSID